MSFDEGLAQRIREVLANEHGVAEKRMFGGIAFLLNGNMAVGVVKEALMVRVGPDAYTDLVHQPHAREGFRLSRGLVQPFWPGAGTTSRAAQ